DDEDKWNQPSQPFETRLNRTGTHSVSFANVDDRLCFWVDDRLVNSLEFEDGSKFLPQKSPIDPTDRDTAPVGIAARGAGLRVAHLKIERDIYYRNESAGGPLTHEKTYRLIDDAD